MLKRLAFLSCVLLAGACQAAVNSVATRPAGSDKQVQFNNSGVFGSSPTFTYDKSTGLLTVSSSSVKYAVVSTATLVQIKWADGTTQTTAAGSGSYVNNTSVLQPNTTCYLSSGTIQTFNVVTVKFADGTTQTSASGSGASNFWVGKATSSLNMNSFAIDGSTEITTASMTVTGSTVMVAGETYVYPSSTSFGTAQQLFVMTTTNGKSVLSASNVILDGMRTSSTDTVTAAKVFQSSITLPLSSQTNGVGSTGQIVVDTGAFTFNGSSSTLVFYADGRKYYVVATTGPPTNQYIPKFDTTINGWTIAQDSGTSSGGGAGNPAGASTSFQYNNGGSFGGVAVATFSNTNNVITFSSQVIHANISSETITNANFVLSGTSKIVYADGTSQSTVGIQNQATLQTGATCYVSSETVQNNLQVTDSDSAQVLQFSQSDLPRSGGFGPQVVDTRIHAHSFDNSGSAGSLYVVSSTQPAFNSAKPYSGIVVTPPDGSAMGTVGVVIGTETLMSFDTTQMYLFAHTTGPSMPLNFYAPGNSNFIGLRAPNSLSGNTTFTLPSADGSTGQFLKTDGAGNLAFAAGGSGGASSLEVFSNFDHVRTSPTASIGIGASLLQTVVGSTSSIDVDPSSGTLQGNTFNAANKLVQLNGSGNLPAVGGASLTGMTASQVGLANVTNNAQIINQSTLQAGATAYPDFVYAGTSETVHGPLKVDTVITAGSGANQITTSTGKLDATQLSGNVSVNNLNGGTGATSSTFWRGDSTWATPSGSGAQDFDLGDSTGANKDVSFSTRAVLNVATITFAGTSQPSPNAQWTMRPSTFSHCPVSFSFNTSSSQTVPGLSFYAVAGATITGEFVLSMNTSSSNSTGFKFLMTGPTSPAYFEMTGGGASSSATSANFSQQASALNTKTQTALGTFTSGAMYFHFTFCLINNNNPGTVTVQVLPNAGNGNNFINQESWLRATMD